MDAASTQAGEGSNRKTLLAVRQQLRIAARYRPGPRELAAYVAAILICGSLYQLPTLEALVLVGFALAVAVTVSPWRRAVLPLLLAAMLGAGWATWSNQRALLDRLPEAGHGADWVLPLRVDSLPAVRDSRSRYGSRGGVDIRFTARVLDSAAEESLRGRHLELTWYGAGPEEQARLRGGTIWTMPVRLKRPRGSVNPHGFDYEGWLLRRNIYATGYIRPQDAQPKLLGESGGVLSAREAIRSRIRSLELPSADLILALVLGDRSGLSHAETQALRNSGTAHLIAISGLHVGMVAGAVALLAGLLARLIGLFLGWTPRLLVPVLSLTAAGLYVLMSGAPLSAQRALVMLAVLLLAWYWRRRLHSALALLLALAIVLTLQPLAFHGPGFWLSFLAVAALLLGFRGRYRVTPRAGLSHSCDLSPLCGQQGLSGLAKRSAGRLLELLRSQWLIGLALLLPSMAFFQGFSAGGFVFNLVAIPWMAVSILPALLIGTLLVGTSAGAWLLTLGSAQLQLLLEMLTGPMAVGGGWFSAGAPASPWLAVMFGLGIFWLLLPAGVPGRALGWVALLVLLVGLPSGWLPRTPVADKLAVTALDVGQGLAVVLRSRDAVLVYDAGPGTVGGWNAGSAIVAPFLLGEGGREVDLLVLSHGDSDHAGGFAGLLAMMPIKRLAAPGELVRRMSAGAGPDGSSRPQGLSGSHSLAAFPCVAGSAFNLGGMRITWLWPNEDDVSGEENDHSCVALVEWRDHRILLAGDISTSVEGQLARRFDDFLPVDLLIAPHHGSRTSSSEAFLRWSQPAAVVFSAGYRHHFGHPHPEVVSRYQHRGARIFSTADSGAVSFFWEPGVESPVVQKARDTGPFWLR
ncbi:ComE operon protein 3 [Microbulbifer aestuariivivens]|uniref:ComE operon protein 3 n=1 Tax=Microbulbifer aestuariivivens TaxID=1908308 RepID=A0ABP9WMT4_9GAMM